MTGTFSRPIGDTNSGTNDWSDVAGEDKVTIDGLNSVLTSANKLDGAQIAAGTIPTAAYATGSIGSAAIGNTSILGGDVQDATLTDAKLASPNNSTYKTVASFGTQYIGGFPVGTRFPTELSGTPSWDVSGGDNPTVAQPIGIFDFASGDYTVSSLTTKFRIRAQVAAGSTSPSTVTFNFGLYPLTLAASNWTLGTVVTGSQTGTAPTPSLATNTISRYTGTDFAASALLSDPGTYVFGVIIGSITVPTQIVISAQLQTRNV